MKAESTTGDETAKTQKQVVIYLLADDYIEVEVQPLTMGDLCEIVGTDRKVADFVKQMPVTGLQPQETGRSVISVLMLVESNHSAGPEAICRYPVPVCAAGSGTVDC